MSSFLTDPTKVCVRATGSSREAGSAGINRHQADQTARLDQMPSRYSVVYVRRVILGEYECSSTTGPTHSNGEEVQRL